MIALIIFTFIILFADSYLLYQSGKRYYNDKLVFISKVTMWFCAIAFPLSVFLYRTGA